LGTVDYRLVDEHTDPLGTGSETHSETLLRLPHCFLCYQPSNLAPAVTPLPALARGQVTFGSFNALPKVTEAVVARWAQILRAVSSSRLLLKSPSFEDETTRDRYRGLFAAHGIEPDRIELRGFVADEAAHLGCYGEVDIGLDPFPYNGTTTTCEALWMGVPVVTLGGCRHAGRVGVSLLSQVDLAHLCASDEEHYVALAVELATGVTELARLRAELRDRMSASPLCDAQRLGAYCDELFEQLVAQAAQTGG
jgi:protein O-GlcNAc transferase